MADKLDDSFFRALFHSELGGIAIADLDKRTIIEANEVLLGMLGLPRDEVVGVRDAWVKATPAEYRHLDETAIQQVLEQGHSDPFEKEYQRPDGSRVPVRVSSAIVPGFPNKLIVYVADMTKEHEAHRREHAIQQRLEIAISAADQGIWDWDLLSGEMVYSDRAKEIYGFPPDAIITYELVRDATPPEDLKKTHALLERALDPNIRDRSKYEYRIVRPDGSICWALAYGEAVFDGPAGSEKAVRYAGTIQDITAQKLAERSQQIMVAELNHRVKNVLAIVQSLAFQTLRGKDIPDEMAETFSGRLQALASAHDLLTEEQWEGANIRGIVQRALEPIATDVGGRIRVDGEDLQLNPQVAVSLSMALHELATNAAKYGALSNHEGRVELSWRVAPEPTPRLHIEWREHDGPAVNIPEHRGFGTRMISRVVSSNLNGRIDLRFEPDGVRCMIDAPVEGVTRKAGMGTTSAQAIELAR